VQQLSTLVLAKLIALSRSVKLKMNHLEHLNYLSRKLFTILDPENLVKTIFSIFNQQTGASKGVILVVDQITEQVEYFSFGQTNDDFMVSVANKKVRDAIFNYWKDSPRITRIKELEINSVALDLSYDKNSDILLLPLYLKDAPYGIVFLECHSFKEFLRETDSDFWHTFCQIIVAAFENARLYKLATVDGLTGLFVRSFFDVQIQKEFLRAVRYNDQVAYMMSDIDHFKIFNDTYGHQMGDRVLRMVSDEIKRSIRNVDIAARYGGEELCVILPNTGRDGAMLIAERVRSNIEALSIPYEGKEIKITVSIGVSSIPENQPPDVDSFIKEADHALYMAKEGGRNQVRFFTKRKVGDT
jgi:diguanylate cyclase (GGDEF)-like protein